ncbi:ribose ABC transporter permease [candidate division KSB3 bacterium]|uniref:Ribose ABC transporter permease n=1 Tax=candidate division KSB3 bacterium TaxID=2044937 RepID=A0A9D5JTQ0_9BACT|nr:ribose ABC transporter permease [candidate division KSB3 bacterium]MBD3324038.1 ribose ABC transporter permease [candidate division KSB3 bacterium]
MKHQLTLIMKQYGIFVGFLLIIIALSILSPAFLTTRNLLNIVRQTSIHGIMAVGMTFVILTAGIDLSVGSMLALTGVLCADFEHKGLPVLVIIAVTLLIGAVLGLFNGIIITKGRVTPFVVTLGMMSIARGFALIYSGGYPISGFDKPFRYIGSGYLLEIPVPIIIFALTIIIAAVVLRQTRLGRYTYAIGGNEETVKLSGINSDLYKAIAYVISGVTSALGAVVLTSRLNAGEPIAGTGYELDVIASVVIGGTSLMGGRGSVWGTLIGALLIGTINNGMNLLGISSYWQSVVKGLIIVGAVLLDRLRED